MKAKITGIVGALILAMAATAVMAGGNSSADRTVEVVAKEFSFEPKQIEVEAGQTVRLKLDNQGSLSHNLFVEGGGHTETIQGGKTATVTVTVPDSGRMAYWCNVPGHREAGMEGTLVVR